MIASTKNVTYTNGGDEDESFNDIPLIYVDYEHILGLINIGTYSN